MEAIKVFQKDVIDAKIALHEADISVSTCHSAKGMEWPRVQVCDDFVDLRCYEEITQSSRNFNGVSAITPTKVLARTEWRFKSQAWSDELNLLYVPCTRAKSQLSVPTKLVQLLEDFDQVTLFRFNDEAEPIEIQGLPRPDRKALISFEQSLINGLPKLMGLEPSELLIPCLITDVDDVPTVPQV
eukprot:scaffold516_cov175-Amphora_coffeaeformis.AAC.36